MQLIVIFMEGFKNVMPAGEEVVCSEEQVKPENDGNIVFQSLALSGLSCSLSSKKALTNAGYQFREIPYG